MANNINDKEKAALEYVKKHKELEPYFFSKLIQKKEIKWLEPLKERGFFDRTSIPIITDREQYIEEWNVLNFVHSVISDLVNNNEQNELNYILEILLQAAEISNNYRVIDQSIKIITIIPLSSYSVEYLNQVISYWFKCVYGLDHILYCIVRELLPVVTQDSIKGLSLYIKVLDKLTELKMDKDYVLNEFINNENILNNITKNNYIDIVNHLISMIENVINVNTSERKIGQIEFTIQKNQNEYTILTNNSLIYKNEFINRQKDVENIIKIIGQSYSNINLEDLEIGVKLLYSDIFSNECFESIFAEKEYLFDFQDYLIVLLKKCIVLNLDNEKETIDIIETTLANKYDLIIKISLFIICSDSRYLSFFLEYSKENLAILDYIVRNYIFGDEIRHLFESLRDIDDEIIRIIDDIIEKGEYIKFDQEDDTHLRIWKQQRYYALNNIPFFNEKYLSLKSITGLNVKLIAPVSFSGMHVVEQKSPLTKERILQMSNNELVNFILNFKEEHNISNFSDISYRGLGQVLGEVIKTSPERILNDLNKFDSLQYQIISSIFESYKEIIRENNIDFGKIINFTKIYTGKDSFWLDEYCYRVDKRFSFTHITFLKTFLWFITEYLSNDEVNYNEYLFNDILELLEYFFNKHNFHNIEDVLFSNNDYDFYSLNSLGGIYSRVLLEASLKIKRINAKNNKALWENRIKILYEKLLAVGCIDGYFILGMFISQFSYIDRPWLITKMVTIKYENPMWQYFVSGYICSRTVNEEFFLLMEENYLLALDFEFLDTDIKRRLIEHIAVAYLNGFDEKSKNKVFEKIIFDWKVDYITEVIRHFQRITGKILVKDIRIDDVNQKVLMFWNRIRQKYEGLPRTLTIEEIRLIQESVSLSNNFNFINDDIEKNLRFTFKFLTRSFNEYYIVDYLEKLIEIGNIDNLTAFKQLIFEFFITCLPSYPEDKLKQLLGYLKEGNDSSEYLEHIMKKYLEGLRGKSVFVEYIANELLEGKTI